MAYITPLAIVNRLEVIDHTPKGKGRSFVKWVQESFMVEVSIQDDGRTLKLFLSDPPKEPTR